MSGRGRKAALPSTDYKPPQRLFADGETCSVHFYPEEGGHHVVFDFTKLTLHRHLQVAMAHAFDRLTGPAGTNRAIGSARLLFHNIRQFAVSCASVPNPPSRPEEITVAHIESHAIRRRSLSGWSREEGQLRLLLRAIDGLPTAVQVFLERPGSVRRDGTVSSYTKAEQKRITQAARSDLRAAAARIRQNTEVLERWREGSLNPIEDPLLHEYGGFLDYVARTGDVPRYDNTWHTQTFAVSQHGGIERLVTALCLTWREAAAACVLLISTTGQNGGTLIAAPAAHHRPDGAAGGTPAAIVNLIKFRRGRRTRYMSVPFVDLPPWVGQQEPGDVVLNEKDELNTPFGIYVLLLELTDLARATIGSRRLFVCWRNHASGRSSSPGARIRDGLPLDAVTDWGRGRDLRADQTSDDGNPLPLIVTMRRLRLTFLQGHQRPVAQTSRTLADDYLIRDKGAIVEYQQVVAKAQAEQVEKARSFEALLVLTEDDVIQAASDLESVARRFKVTVDVLKRILAGKLDTVLAACVDYNNSPFSPPGQPCDASFFMCLQCECARATPQHLPILVLVYDELRLKQHAMTPLVWSTRFMKPYTQLEDLIDRFGNAAVSAAREDVTDQDRILVRRLLDRELDV